MQCPRSRRDRGPNAVDSVANGSAPGRGNERWGSFGNPDGTTMVYQNLRSSDNEVCKTISVTSGAVIEIERPHKRLPVSSERPDPAWR